METEQESFWRGKFGQDYTQRNDGDQIVAGNIALFGKILRGLIPPQDVLELGANRGLNLKAIRSLLPAANLSAVEINAAAAEELRKWGGCAHIHETSLLDFRQEGSADFVLFKGVLIHIAPEELHRAYEAAYTAARKYICLVEYYNPSPVEVSYRGHQGKLFKRDFAGEMLDRYPDLRLLEYGFSYHRDPIFPQDDLTWFVLEKRTP